MSDRSFEIGIEDVLGRRVRARNGRVIGRIEEIRAERRGDTYEVTEFLIGPGALLERLAVIQQLLSRKPRMLVAAWTEIAIEPEGDARLTVGVDELRTE